MKMTAKSEGVVTYRQSCADRGSEVTVTEKC